MDLFPCHAVALAQYTVYIYESLKAQPNHRGAGKHDPHPLSTRLHSYSMLCMPSMKPYRQSLLHTARQRRVRLQWESPLSFTVSPATLHATPLWHVSFGNISRSCCGLALVSTTSTEAVTIVSVRFVIGKINNTCSISIPGAMPIQCYKRQKCLRTNVFNCMSALFILICWNHSVKRTMWVLA